MKSKTQINNWMHKKTNTELVETIFLAKKTDNIQLASEISLPARQLAAVNLSKINESKSDVIIVPGKVLSNGEIKSKKIIYALSFSENARTKMKAAGCEFSTILEALKKMKKTEKLKGEIIK